jgi:hypothetical protein
LPLGSIKKLEDFLIKNSVFTHREKQDLSTDIWEVVIEFAKRTRTNREDILLQVVPEVNFKGFIFVDKISEVLKKHESHEWHHLKMCLK